MLSSGIFSQNLVEDDGGRREAHEWQGTSAILDRAGPLNEPALRRCSHSDHKMQRSHALLIVCALPILQSVTAPPLSAKPTGKHQHVETRKSPDTINDLPQLQRAAQLGDTEELLLLLGSGVDPDALGETGYTALIIAANNNQVAAAKILLAHGAAVNRCGRNAMTALHAASAQGHAAMVEFLCEHGASVTAAADPHGYTALLFAAMGGHATLIPLLLARGSQLDARAKTGYTPLHLAAYHDRADAAIALLDGGASTSSCGKEGFTPLHLAAFGGRAAMAELLMAHGGADVSATTKEGNTALHVAAYRGHADAARVLLDAGAPIDARGLFGDTPLRKRRPRCVVEPRPNRRPLPRHLSPLDRCCELESRAWQIKQPPLAQCPSHSCSSPMVPLVLSASRMGTLRSTQRRTTAPTFSESYWQAMGICAPGTWHCGEACCRPPHGAVLSRACSCCFPICHPSAARREKSAWRRRSTRRCLSLQRVGMLTPRVFYSHMAPPSTHPPRAAPALGRMAVAIGRIVDLLSTRLSRLRRTTAEFRWSRCSWTPVPRPRRQVRFSLTRAP